MFSCWRFQLNCDTSVILNSLSIVSTLSFSGVLPRTTIFFLTGIISNCFLNIPVLFGYDIRSLMLFSRSTDISSWNIHLEILSSHLLFTPCSFRSFCLFLFSSDDFLKIWNVFQVPIRSELALQLVSNSDPKTEMRSKLQLFVCLWPSQLPAATVPLIPRKVPPRIPIGTYF